jgi:hypothetical protein
VLGVGTAKTRTRRTPDYGVGQWVDFQIHGLNQSFPMFGEISEHVGPREYVVVCASGARYRVRVNGDGEFESGIRGTV